MKYNLKRFSHLKLSNVFENKLENRSYFIPFPNKKDCLKSDIISERSDSAMVKNLSGIWDFKYISDIDFLSDDFDSEKEIFDKINLPSSWQDEGFGIPLYLKESYPFKYLPPHIPKGSVGTFYSIQNNRKIKVNNDEYGNTAGIYRKIVEISDLNKYYVISFLGVESGMELHINGKYVGFCQGSLKTNEFLVNDFLVEGKNEILVVVYKWTVSSYLECGDRYRTSGILRDVLLFQTEKEHIFDIKIYDEKKKNNGYRLHAELSVVYAGKSTIKAEVYDGDELIAEKTQFINSNVFFDFDNLNVKEWSAENPKLYTVLFTIYDGEREKECVRIQHGFKSVEINNNVFLINNKKVKLKGINYIEGSSKLNSASASELEKDIILMKKFNINAVSVISPDPLFLALCDKYGLYVLDNSNISLGKKLGRITMDSASLSTKSKWSKMFLEKIKNQYMRDKNYTSVIIWSIGYNLASGKCTELCYNYLKYMSKLPVICYGTQNSAYSDMRCDEYESVETVEKQLYKNNNKPSLAVKYSFEGGIGGGRLDEYVRLILKDSGNAGGFIWQFSDQSYRNKNGKYEYLYGGDMKEYIHDGFACLSGIFLPDRTPKTSAYNVKSSYRKLRASFIEEKLKIYNTDYFSDSSDFEISYRIVKNNSVLEEGKVDKNIEPQSAFEKKFNIDISDDCRIDIEYKKDNDILKDQLILSEKIPVYKYECGGNINVKHGEDFMTVEFDDGYIKFVTKTGQLANYVINGVEYVNQNPVNSRHRLGLFLNFYRSPFDSEMNYKKAWQRNLFHNYKCCLRGISANKVGDKAVIEIKTAISAPFKILFFVKDVYTIYAGGIMHVECHVTPKNSLPYLPKLGKCLEMPDSFDNIEYYGLGDMENYPDFNEHASLGLYKGKVSDFECQLIRPQESGNRGRVRYFKISDNDSNALYFIADEKFMNINFKHHTPDMEIEYKHREDIRKVDTTAVYIDEYVKNIGVFLKNGNKRIMKNQNKNKKLSFVIVPADKLKKID